MTEKPHKQRTTHYARRAHAVPLTLFLLLLLLFFHKMAFSNLILARGDTFLYFYPYWQAAADALRDGRIPLWNSALFMGSPFVANSQVGFFYPLNWPLWLLLETPYAVSVSILLHLALAGVGAYFAARWLLTLEKGAAWLTAVLFALGGYVTAQVEHVNQLQGLAWLPWYLVVIGWCARGGSAHGGSARGQRSLKRTVGWATVAFSFLFTMQLLAGHTQTAFISGITVALWLAAEFVSHFLLRSTEYGLRFTLHWQRLKRSVPLALLFGGLLALLLTAVQLLPTLQLMQHSSRQGGLSPNEVLSFSLHPLLLTRALLPAYGQSLFSEYVAIVPLTAVLLAVIGAWQWRRSPSVFAALVLVGVGLLLAIGLFNPGNWLLARLPGFNLFRVPARWLIMYMMGLSLLAGVGFQVMLDRYWQRAKSWQEIPERARENLVHIERPLRVAICILVGLMFWNALAGILTIFIPTGVEAPFESLHLLTLLLWLVELMLVYWILTGERLAYNGDGRFKIGMKRSRPRSPYWLLLIIVVSLFAATRTHPYNNLTTPEAYFDWRPPIARLQPMTCNLQPATCDHPPDRFLSLSNIFFDVGDQAEIDSIYSDQLSEEARYDHTVATKHKEVIGPNLPMAFGLASVDGFDGGILPLQAYTQLMQLILPEGTQTTDGRLREYLTAVPPAKWLDLFNTRYLITDKTGDVWRQVDFREQSVYFDAQHPLPLDAGESFSVAYAPPFTATAVLLLMEGEPGMVEVMTGAGEQWQLTPVVLDSGLAQASAPLPDSRATMHTPFTPQAITFHATDGAWHILAASLLNEADGTFLPLTLGNYRLIHSGDVKIYENLDVLPRAFLLGEWQWQPDVAASVAAMAAEGFDPRVTAVLTQAETVPHRLPETAAGAGSAQITHYEPGLVTMQVENESNQFLMLTEAYYPGWRAWIDDLPATLYRADGYFQGVFLPPGSHEVRFEFEARSVGYGRLISLVALLLWVVLIAIISRKPPDQESNHENETRITRDGY